MCRSKLSVCGVLCEGTGGETWLTSLSACVWCHKKLNLYILTPCFEKAHELLQPLANAIRSWPSLRRQESVLLLGHPLAFLRDTPSHLLFVMSHDSKSGS